MLIQTKLFTVPIILKMIALYKTLTLPVAEASEAGSGPG